jgi:hypothetical protein
MKQLILTIAALIGAAAPMAVLAEQPPLIDRNLFFGEIAIAGAQISPDGRFISMAADPNTGVPPTRPLTNLKGVRTEIFVAPKAKPDILYIGLNDRDPRWHDLYELHLSTGEKALLRKNTENIAAWVFDNEGTLRLAERTNAVGDTEILRVDPDGFK